MKKRHQISYVDLAINIKSHTEWMNYYSFIRRNIGRYCRLVFILCYTAYFILNLFNNL